MSVHVHSVGPKNKRHAIISIENYLKYSLRQLGILHLDSVFGQESETTYNIIEFFGKLAFAKPKTSFLDNKKNKKWQFGKLCSTDQIEQKLGR